MLQELSQIEDSFMEYFSKNGWQVDNHITPVAIKTYDTYLNPTDAIVWLNKYRCSESGYDYFVLAPCYLSSVDNPLRNYRRAVDQTSLESAILSMSSFLVEIEANIDRTLARKLLLKYGHKE
ncbi:hypothetical protein [Vibrio sp. 1180_3]|uniref:hypothetical protein n=1 Tax=Vibrio sp. 1180_3 TaxID=2528832 RepID=UPI0024055EB5|nr:hypothetical protein [Vibrio sp. 1180_3]MDF9399085.1 hypothetical protein [Vibrio sp. 1180_3]